MDITRRSLLAGGVAVTALACSKQSSAKTETPHGEYVWALKTKDIVVRHATWTPITYDKIVLNTTNARLDTDQATWIFPTVNAQGMWAILLDISWDNAKSPEGHPIRPKTHRKLARIPQQSVATNQLDEPAYPVASTDLTYHADLAELDDQDLLADGSKGFQQQQVYVQTGVQRTGADQRVWVEVYQNSGQPLAIRFDGSHAPRTADRPPIVGLQAPSLMMAKVCDF